jgi:predicted regulator of Ras-like GTPase activity (Roadblock/LC7/MglB family)
MFRESIQKMIDRLDPPGGATGILMGFDGIAVDSYTRPGVLDVQTMGMELAHVVSQIRRSAQGGRFGALGEVQLLTDKVAVLIRLVSNDYFLILGLAPEGNLGRARYLLRVLAPEIRASL